jgi:hypothetical protein
MVGKSLYSQQGKNQKTFVERVDRLSEILCTLADKIVTSLAEIFANPDNANLETTLSILEVLDQWVKLIAGTLDKIESRKYKGIKAFHKS